MSRETDRSIERRRCVSAFLDGMKKRRESSSGSGNDQQQQQQQVQQQLDSSATNNMESMLDDVGTIPRKNVEDVHSTYRIGSSENNKQGKWHRIPSLLLVKGDFMLLDDETDVFEVRTDAVNKSIFVSMSNIFFILSSNSFSFVSNKELMFCDIIICSISVRTVIIKITTRAALVARML